MRLKKGDKVEVMNKKDVSICWRVAEILYGNGHTYRVQYDYCPGLASERKVETVSKKFVRPCQPLVQDVDNFISGDIVEVFYENAWRTAVIFRVLGGKGEFKSKKIAFQAAAVQKQYLAMLLGCSQELIVDELNIRTKQTWHDDKWILYGKCPLVGEDVATSKPSTSICYEKMKFQIPQFNARAKRQPRKDWKNILDQTPFQKSHNYSRSLKRMCPYSSSIKEAYNGHNGKLRAIEKDERVRRLGAAQVIEEVDAVAYPRENLGEKNMHTSFRFISTGHNQVERAKLNDVLGCHGARNSPLNSSDCDACSVGSCSVSDQSPNNHDIPSMPLLCQERQTISSDAESCCGSGFERKSSSLPQEEEVEVSVRGLELHAYRRTLEALYASGPLSWEHESMLTNLRIMLHISNDEHLMELKNLISAKTAISFR